MFSILNSFYSPPGSERHVEVLAQVEDVQGQPAHDEQQEGGQQQVTPAHVPPFLLIPSEEKKQ